MYNNKGLLMERTADIDITDMTETQITDVEGPRDLFLYNNQGNEKPYYWWVNNFKEFLKD